MVVFAEVPLSWSFSIADAFTHRHCPLHGFNPAKHFFVLPGHLIQACGSCHGAHLKALFNTRWLSCSVVDFRYACSIHTCVAFLHDLSMPVTLPMVHRHRITSTLPRTHAADLAILVQTSEATARSLMLSLSVIKIWQSGGSRSQNPHCCCPGKASPLVRWPLVFN